MDKWMDRRLTGLNYNSITITKTKEIIRNRYLIQRHHVR